MLVLFAVQGIWEEFLGQEKPARVWVGRWRFGVRVLGRSKFTGHGCSRAGRGRLLALGGDGFCAVCRKSLCPVLVGWLHVDVGLVSCGFGAQSLLGMEVNQGLGAEGLAGAGVLAPTGNSACAFVLQPSTRLSMAEAGESSGWLSVLLVMCGQGSRHTAGHQACCSPARPRLWPGEPWAGVLAVAEEAGPGSLCVGWVPQPGPYRGLVASSER